MKKIITCQLIFLTLSSFNCKSAKDQRIIEKQNASNFFISIYDMDIDRPENDRRCYYKIYINKVEAGRTNTGLESQMKEFDVLLAHNKHLIKVEKWVLNETLGRYVKMNNIDQPKPDYIYVNIEKGKVVRIKMKSSKTGLASYGIEVE